MAQMVHRFAPECSFGVEDLVRFFLRRVDRHKAGDRLEQRGWSRFLLQLNYDLTRKQKAAKTVVV